MNDRKRRGTFNGLLYLSSHPRSGRVLTLFVGCVITDHGGGRVAD